MLKVLISSWALLLGMLLLMVGNGMQGTLLGVRGGLEGFSTLSLSIIISAYFLGFLGGSRLAPEMIRRVGHVRVFAALGSFISAALILFPVVTEPWAWTLLRVALGFSFSGVYVTAESWLNNSVSNETRGQAISAYMIVQMGGIVAAQGLLAFGDPSGFVLFIIPSVLVSISFAPILLSINPTPPFEATKPMSIMQLFTVSPLGCVGAFLLGGVYSATYGMAAVFGTMAGMSVTQISIFVGAIYLGGLAAQFPVGWLSDRMDRRRLILAVAAIGGLACLLAMVPAGFTLLIVAALIIGGTTNPLYALVIAHTNDYLEHEDMASASGGLIFLNGVGAVAGPLVTGWFMGVAGPEGFFVYLGVLLGALSAYGLWRMTRRPGVDSEDTVSYAPVLPTSTAVTMEAAAHEVYAEHGDHETATD